MKNSNACAAGTDVHNASARVPTAYIVRVIIIYVPREHAQTRSGRSTFRGASVVVGGIVVSGEVGSIRTRLKSAVAGASRPVTVGHPVVRSCLQLLPVTGVRLGGQGGDGVVVVVVLYPCSRNATAHGTARDDVTKSTARILISLFMVSVGFSVFRVVSTFV